MSVKGSITQLRREIMKEAKDALQEAKEISKSDAEMELMSYYEEGEPEVYRRTNLLETAAKTERITRNGSGDGYQFRIYLNEHLPYKTGKFQYNPVKVLIATDKGTAGTLGKHGYWDRIEYDVEQAVDISFGRHFN